MQCLFVGVCINQMLFHMYICYTILWYNNSKKVEGNMIEKILAYILACWTRKILIRLVLP